MSDTIALLIKDFIVENFLFGDDTQLDKNMSFIENDIIDSTGVLELVAFLEDEMGVEVEDEDIVPANLDSINKICAYVERKQNTKQSAA